MPVEPGRRERSQSETGEPMVRASRQKARVRVTLLTDPWSVWCWGFEPVRRALELRYPTIEFRNLLGGMFPRMPRPQDAGFDIERFFSVVQRTTGMPVSAETVRRDPADSTYPSCIHVHAVRLAAPEKERRYLRALREAVYLDGQNISRPPVALRVARRVGVDPAAFREALTSGRAEASFQEALEKIHRQGLHSYPTLLVRTKQQLARVEGFQTLPAVLTIAQSLSRGRHAPLPDPPLQRIIPAGERVATREVAEVLGVSMERALDRLDKARDEGLLERDRHPTGDVWRRVAPPPQPDIVPAP